MNAPHIILASTSPYRANQLRQIHLKFEQLPPDCDEDSYKAKGLKPIELARTLAIAKAKSLSATHTDCLVIGGDQLVSFEGEILGKSHTAEMAFAQLQRMQGKSHELHSAVAVAKNDEVFCQVESARLKMRLLSEDQIRRYIVGDRPTDCAGSYKIEAFGISLFEEVDCKDPSAITGLPLIALCQILGRFGLSVP